MKNLKNVWLFVACMTVGFGFAQDNESFDNSNQTEAINEDISNDIHFVAEASTHQVSVDDEINIEYKLYISPNVGVSSWELLETPDYDGLNFENIKLEDLIIENVTYNGKPYRMVLVKKDILKATKGGYIDVKPLQLQITAEVADANGQIEFNSLIKKVTATILSNSLQVNVKP